MTYVGGTWVVSAGPYRERRGAERWVIRHHHDRCPMRSTNRRRPCLGCQREIGPTMKLFCVECHPFGASLAEPLPWNREPCDHPPEKVMLVTPAAERDDHQDVYRCACGFAWTKPAGYA